MTPFLFPIGVRKYVGVEPKIEGKPPKMDGLFHGKPELKMDELRGFSHYFWKHPCEFLEVYSPFFLFKYSPQSLRNGT